MVSEKIVNEIIRTYGQAWEDQDTNKLLSIFKEDGVYHEDLHEEPLIGHKEIADYWNTKVCLEQSDIKFSPQKQYIVNDTVLLEWEATLNSSRKGARLNLKGIMIIEVENKLIRSLREYWNSERLPLKD